MCSTLQSPLQSVHKWIVSFFSEWESTPLPHKEGDL